MRAMALEFLRQGRQAVLLYTARTQAEAAFLGELQALAGTHPGQFQLVFSVSGRDSSAWNGRRGRIDRALIQEQVCAILSPLTG